MAKAKFIQDGDTIDYTPSSAVEAGDIVIIGNIIGVAKMPIPAYTLGAISTVGVYDLPKDTGGSTGIAVGTPVYWNASASQVTADDDDAANIPIGKTVLVAADGDATVRVKLGGGSWATQDISGIGG